MNLANSNRLVTNKNGSFFKMAIPRIQNVRTYKDNECKFKSIMFGTAKQGLQVVFDACRD
ncbi:hypothetical protein DBR43_09625 [Pedobacter sp. KBW06]|nr:hypothetical protein DBR43_09625 [Pedobacter sp. KBW06]